MAKEVAKDSKKKKRWYGELTGGGVKTTLGVKRKPNRKDRERARALLGTESPRGAAISAAKNGVAEGGKAKTHSNAPKQQKIGKPTTANGKGKTGGAGSKRALGEHATALDRHDKHKQSKVGAGEPAPAIQQQVSTVPKTEKGQKLQELLRLKLAKANAAKGASDQNVKQAAKKVSTAESHQAAHNESAIQHTQEPRQSPTTRDPTITVVNSKVATGQVSSNWLALKQGMKREKRRAEKGKSKPDESKRKAGVASAAGDLLPSELELMNCVGPLGIDCEMVGVGEGGHRSVLARVSLVDANGDTIMDTFVAPQEKVVDYRTRVSGVRPSDLKGAPTFERVQALVSIATKNKVLVGHSLQHDLNALMLTHQKTLIRDTAKYRPYQNAAKKPRKLRDLAQDLLGMSIQGGEHSSVEDARAALLLYRLASSAWEKELKAKGDKLAGRRDKRAKKGGGVTR